MSALSAIASVGVTGLHAKTPKQLFIHFAFFPPSNYSTSTELQASHHVPFYSFFFPPSFATIFQGSLRPKADFAERLDERMQARSLKSKRCIRRKRVCVFVLRKKTRRKGEGGGGEKRETVHSAETTSNGKKNLLHLLKRQVCRPPPSPPPPLLSSGVHIEKSLIILITLGVHLHQQSCLLPCMCLCAVNSSLERANELF